MQPFPIFDVVRVVERDLTQWHDDRARQRAAEGYPIEKASEQPSRTTRLIALLMPTRQPKPSSSCGD
jgi:hypothetical protein